ncbi:hypothetical protein CR513_00341, partial [Mucuna pruriens]
MGSSSINWEGLSPKSKYIKHTMNELREKLDLVGKGLDTLSKAKKDGFGEGNYNDHNKSSRSSRRRERHERNRREERHERRERREEDRRDELDTRKCKIPPFVWNSKPEELKVEQVITSFDIQGQKGVRGPRVWRSTIRKWKLKAQLMESKETTKARFLHWLNREI